MPPSEAYTAKRAFYDRMLTIYGRHAVLEALEQPDLPIHKLHLARSNAASEVQDRMVRMAQNRGIDIAYHDKQSLSRISKNGRQDQGVALDIVMDHFRDERAFLSEEKRFRVVALDGVTNPKNLGMIVRSCAAGRIDALLLPMRGTARISPQVVQASAGTLFKLPIIRTPDLRASLRRFREQGAAIYALEADAPTDYRSIPDGVATVFVLGNETEGISPAVADVCTDRIAIPMARGVASLNVAVTAALLAFA